MPLLARRPARYVPRHSTRDTAGRWTGHRVLDLTDTGETPAQDVLASVLAGLDELDRAGRA